MLNYGMDKKPHHLAGKKQSPEHIAKRKAALALAIKNGAKPGWPAGVPRTPETIARIKAGLLVSPSVAARRVWSVCAKCGCNFRSQNAGQKHCSRDCAFTKKSIRKAGYVYIWKKELGKYILEHREIMEKMIGRPLLKNENVHHKNGKRDDNSPENLELWVKSQPPGQRVEDLTAWAREIIALYGDLQIQITQS